MLFQQINGKKVYVVLADTELTQQQAVAKANQHFKVSPKKLTAQMGWITGRYLWLGEEKPRSSQIRELEEFKEASMITIDHQRRKVWVVSKK